MVVTNNSRGIYHQLGDERKLTERKQHGEHHHYVLLMKWKKQKIISDNKNDEERVKRSFFFHLYFWSKERIPYCTLSRETHIYLLMTQTVIWTTCTYCWHLVCIYRFIKWSTIYTKYKNIAGLVLLAPFFILFLVEFLLGAELLLNVGFFFWCDTILLAHDSWIRLT